MIYRLIKLADLKDVVNIHYATRSVNNNGIFAIMGKSFIKEYYKLVIKSQYTVIIGAQNDDGHIIGHCYVILDCRKFDQYINKNTIHLIIGAFVSIIRQPSILKKLMDRYKSLKKRDGRYFIKEGVRGGFWGWNPQYSDPIASIEMHNCMLKIIRDLGFNSFAFEVDRVNKKVYKLHKINGAKEFDSIILSDGRERAFMKYDLKNIK